MSFVTPTLLDGILAGVACEALVLGGLAWRRAGPPLLLALLLYLASGAALLLALRASLVDPGSPGVAVGLSVSLPAHLASLWSIHRLLPSPGPRPRDPSLERSV